MQIIHCSLDKIYNYTLGKMNLPCSRLSHARIVDRMQSRLGTFEFFPVAYALSDFLFFLPYFLPAAGYSLGIIFDISDLMPGSLVLV
jgi:hypothetical protein